jgi:hypothetical protein
MIVRQRLDTQALDIERTVPGGTSAGKLHIALGDQQVDVPLVTAGPIHPPGTVWRLLRINLRLSQLNLS